MMAVFPLTFQDYFYNFFFTVQYKAKKQSYTLPGFQILLIQIFKFQHFSGFGPQIQCE